jgi:hypothetical protein
MVSILERNIKSSYNKIIFIEKQLVEKKNNHAQKALIIKKMWNLKF